jgi:hypothetical protein
MAEDALFGTGPLNPDEPSPTSLPGLPPPPSMPMTAAGSPGSLPAPMSPTRRPTRYQELNEAKDAYLQKTPGRAKSALLGVLRGALQGEASGGGLGGAIGGAAAGGVAGGIDPRGQRERQFYEQVAPQIGARWQFEDYDRAQQSAEQKAQQDALMNRGKLAELEADIDLKRSTAEKNRLPRPERPHPTKYVEGRGLFDEVLQQFIPGTAGPEKPLAPHWARDEKGRFVNLNAPENKGKTVRGYDRPRAPKAAKEPKKTIAISDLRAWAEENKMTVDRAGAKWRADGYTITRDR